MQAQFPIIDGVAVNDNGPTMSTTVKPALLQAGWDLADILGMSV